MGALPNDFERRAMNRRTALVNPTHLLRRVRESFVEAGGSPKAFDYAVNDYAASTKIDDLLILGEPTKVEITDDMVRRAMLAGMNELGALPDEIDGEHEHAFRVALTEALKDV